MKKTYEPPVMEVWRIDLQRSADLLVSLSLQGNVSDFEPGDDEDLIVDDWGAELNGEIYEETKSLD